MTKRSSDVVWHPESIAREDREQLLSQKGTCLWFTGLSGSGKSTIANQVCFDLHQLGRHTALLDGDNIRHGLNGDLGFDDLSRVENIRRISEVAKILTQSGTIVLTAFISPFREDRQQAREKMGAEDFIEVFVDSPVDLCEKRDPKGLYAKARAGELKNFTGIDSPYEEPTSPELILKNDGPDLETLSLKVIDLLKEQGRI
jgi:adenylyl-sulfate kinase